MGKTGAPKRPPSAKRRLPDGVPADADPSAKKLLSSNPYAVLRNGEELPAAVEKKEKMPPFFVKGFPEGLHEKIDFFIKKGLKCTIRLCSDGYKLMVPDARHYKAMQTLLEQEKCEYFSHDIEANKPLKVVLRGLPDMEIDQLTEELKENGLKIVAVYKIARHDVSRKYRDQLYLLHLEKNSINLMDLKNIRTLFHIVVNWVRYKPVHRDVTQCQNCLLFGHGTKNCHMANRCNKCGEQHKTDACEMMDEADPKCANCGDNHRASSKTCPKRAEFIAIRKKASTSNQPGRRRAPEINEVNYPAVQQRRPIPVLPPLPLNQRLAAAAASVPSNAARTSNPPGFPSQQTNVTSAASWSQDSPTPGLSYANVTAGTDSEESLLSTEEIVQILSQAVIIKRTCRTRTEQINAMMSFLSNYGP